MLGKLFPKGGTLKSKDGEQPSKDAIYLSYLAALALIQDDAIQKRLQKELIREYVALEKKVDQLLKNTLPKTVAEEIKYGGIFTPRPCDCTILFADLVGFTRLAEDISASKLIEMPDNLFQGMDDILADCGGTKIKTIGDAYMAVFGAPQPLDGHPRKAVRAGLAFLQHLDMFNRREGQNMQMRVGIHTGSVMAGVVGKERKQFDIFGDNVNIASRFESAGVPTRVNVSHETYIKSREFYEFEERGEIPLKNKAPMKAYLVRREKT